MVVWWLDYGFSWILGVGGVGGSQRLKMMVVVMMKMKKGEMRFEHSNCYLASLQVCHCFHLSLKSTENIILVFPKTCSTQ